MEEILILMKKLLFLFVIFAVIFPTLSFSAEVNPTLRFGWTQDTTNLDHWTLYQGSQTGGPYTEILNIPWDGIPNTTYSALNTFTVTGNPGENITKYFILTSTSTSGTESECSNEVGYVFEFPIIMAAPQSLTVTVEVQ